MSALYRSIWSERLDALCDEYRIWCRGESLPHVDAHQQLCGPVSEAQRRWLQDFCKRWEKLYED
jgi:hypothetical protein